MVKSDALFKAIGSLGKAGMLLAIILDGLWLLFAHMAFGYWATWIVKIETLLLIAFVISFALSKKWPWVPVLIGWSDCILIAMRIVPWNPRGASSWSHQFLADLIFLISAHLALIAQYQLHRKRTPIPSVVSFSVA